MSGDKHSLKGTRYERMEQEVQRMLNKKRPREGDDEHAPTENKRKFVKKSSSSGGERERKVFKTKPSKPTSSSSSSVAPAAKPAPKTVPKPAAAPTKPAVKPEDVPAGAQSLINDRTVYIQGLPFSCEEGDVRQFFADTGEIVSLRLPRWHDSGKLKGYGHVEFSTVEEADQALELSGSYIGKRYVTVEKPMVPRAFSVDPATQASKVSEKPPGCKTIFIRNLPYETSEAEIREKFMVFGPIMKVRLAVWGHTNNLKGFGYIDFKREDSADIAVKKSGSVSIQDRVISVDYESGAPKAGYKGDKVLNANKPEFGKKK